MLEYGRNLRNLAGGYAALAGAVDAIGFLKSGGLFVSFMSGNSTLLAVGFAEAGAFAAAATGLTFNDLMLQTPSRLRGMIYAAHVQAGMQMTKVSAKAHADYLATLDAIAKRLRAEKAARDAAASAAK